MSFDPSIRRRASFNTTQWSVVIDAGRTDPDVARDALAELCRAYWYPLYAYLRRRGHPGDEAEDLVQGFFARLLEKGVVAKADRERGRFRTFLLTALTNFAANEFGRQRRLKRGGDQPLIELDAATAEAQYALEPTDTETPQDLFERRWVLTVFERALADLRRRSEAAGRAEFFAAIRDSLLGQDIDVRYQDLASALGLSEGALRVAVHRLRKSLKRRIEEEIAQTVADPGDVESELQFLRVHLARVAPEIQ